MQVPDHNEDAGAAFSDDENTDAAATELRERRIADYMKDSLTKSDPFEANLGVVNADLMKIAHRFQRVLDGAMQQPPETLAEMTEFVPGLDSYLRVVKQVDRFSQLALKLQAGKNED